MTKRIIARSLLAAILALNSLALAAAAQQQPSPQAAPPQPESVDSLKARMLAHITQPRFAPAAWGVKVVSLDTSKVIFDHNAQKYFSPASNAKLYTGALALEQLGADYRIKTSLYSTARPDASGTLKADLLIYGRGDPTFAASLNEGDYYRSLEPLVTSLVNAGVRRVEGDLIGDESYFRGPPFGSGWEWDDLQWYYGAEVSALTINDNSLDLFVKPAERLRMPCRITTGPATSHVTLINRTQTAPKGTEPRIAVYRPVGENIVYVSGTLPMEGAGYTGHVAVHNPAALFASMFKEALQRRGVIVTGRVRTIDWKYREVTPIDFAKLVEIGSVESLPVKDIVRLMMKPSQNLWAQLLLLQVGANYRPDAYEGADVESATRNGASNGSRQPQDDPSPQKTTEQIGIEALQDFLDHIGIKRGDVVLEEGSGLSRRDMVTPAATIDLLAFMSRHRNAALYLDSLPVAGVDGTLRNRMKGTLAATNLRAKTGSLSYVHTLSGYVTTAAGERLAFSIMLNNYYNSDRTIPARDDIDALALMLASFSGKTQ